MLTTPFQKYSFFLLKKSQKVRRNSILTLFPLSALFSLFHAFLNGEESNNDPRPFKKTLNVEKSAIYRQLPRENQKPSGEVIFYILGEGLDRLRHLKHIMEILTIYREKSEFFICGFVRCAFCHYYKVFKRKMSKSFFVSPYNFFPLQKNFFCLFFFSKIKCRLFY